MTTRETKRNDRQIERGSTHIRRSPAYRVGQAFNYAILTLLGFATLYPFWYCLIVSFNNGKDALKGGLYFLPRIWTLDNYAKAFTNPLIGSSFLVSLSRTVIVVILSVLVTALMAYALTRKTLPGRRFLLMFFFFTTIFSGGFIPTYLMYRDFGLTNNYWILILPSLYSVFNMMLLRTFFQTIPESLPESARIDGAGETLIFFRIIFPLSMSVIATVALFVGVGAWNDWFTGAYYMSAKREAWPAATLLNSLMQEAVYETNPNAQAGNVTQNEALLSGAGASTTAESLKMAFLLILTTPIMAVYPFLQKYFATGVMIGSIKE